MPGDRGIGLSIIGACLLVFGLTGCFSGQLGEPCDKESDCDSGLRCYSPPESSRKLCSVLCENGSCSGGACISTTDGEICVPSCSAESETSLTCPDGLACQLNESGTPSDLRDADYACWVSDQCLNVADGSGPGIEIVKTEIEQGNWEDSAEVSVYVRNTGTEAIKGLHGSVDSLPADVSIIECRALYFQGSWQSSSCDSDCDCSQYAFDLQPCQTYPQKALKTILRWDAADIETPFTVDLIFTDAQGNTWTDSVDVEVAQ